MAEHLKIEGIICSDDIKFDIDKFTDEFIDWIESKGLYFGGGLTPLDSDKKTEELQIGERVVVQDMIDKRLNGRKGYIIAIDRNVECPIVVDLHIADDIFGKYSFKRENLRSV